VIEMLVAKGPPEQFPFPARMSGAGHNGYGRSFHEVFDMVFIMAT